MRKLLSIFCALLVVACDQLHPTSPSALPPTSTPATAVPPIVPANVFGEPFTVFAPGTTVSRRVDSSVGGDDNPHCVGLRGWGCQYFRITPAANGVLDITLTWVVETQPRQGLDLSLDYDRGAAEWSSTGPGPSQVLTVFLDAGQTYQVTVWYTFPGLEFELRSSFSPR